MRTLILAVFAILVGCSASNPQKESNVIVADGTEVDQFESMFFCGDKEGFVVALGDVGSHLGKAWDGVMGEDNKEKCTIRISTNRTGEILGYEVVSCENATRIREVLEVASPVPVPNDECLVEKVNGVSYTINSNEEES